MPLPKLSDLLALPNAAAPTGGHGLVLDPIGKIAADVSGLARIRDILLAVPAPTIDFPAIPQTFARLLIVANLRSDQAGSGSGGFMRFNGDTGANYDWQLATASAAVLAASEHFAQTQISVQHASASDTAGVFSGSVIFIPNYTGTTAQKSSLDYTNNKRGTTTGLLGVALTTGSWRSTAAINQITFAPSSGNFIAGCRITIYALG